MSATVLDELIFQANPLGEPLPKWPPDLSIQLPSPALPIGLHSATSNLVTSNLATSNLALSSPGGRPATKPFSQAAPLFGRRSPMLAAIINWPAYCGLLRDLGLSHQAHFREVESLSDVNVPTAYRSTQLRRRL